MQILSKIDFTNIPPTNLCLEKIASVGTGPAGRLYINVATGFVECWNGLTTLILGSPQSVLANANTLALRDGSGNLTAVTFNGTLNGNAATATLAANSMQLGSQAGSYYLSRTNHTGTQLSGTISDFTSAVQSSSLDELEPPEATVNWNQFSIINLADPVNPQDAVNKRYVDGNVAFVESNFLSKAVYDPSSTGVVNYAVTATLLAGVSPSYYLNRANHTGTQLASSISNFVGTVQSVTLDTLSPPLTTVDLNGQKISLLAAPGVGTDAANKSYVDNAINAIPPVQWSNVQGTPTLRGNFVALPTIGDTTAAQQTEAEGYDHYYFMSTSGWRRVMSIPFRQWVAAPATSSSTGTTGQSAYDSSYFYFCLATNTWQRIALSTWAGGTPFTATAAAPAGYVYTDGSYFYVATAINTWQRFALLTLVSQSMNFPNGAGNWGPGLPGMEAFVQDAGRNNHWAYCTGQNDWRTANLVTF